MIKKWIGPVGVLALVVTGCSIQNNSDDNEQGDSDNTTYTDVASYTRTDTSTFNNTDTYTVNKTNADTHSETGVQTGMQTDNSEECTIGSPLTGGTPYCRNGLSPLGNGYSYEIWMDTQGDNCGTMYGKDAAFKAEWNLGDGGDFLARAGLFFGATEPHTEIGTISADYAFIKPDDNGFSWVAVYGWTFASETFGSLMEYYIVEDWSIYRPATNYDHKGTLEVDGGTYDIYYNRREDAMSPKGKTDFDQIWSIRQEPRDCGHISISEHLNKWSSLGMDVSGLLREAMLLVEALNGSGTVDFTYATVQVEDTVSLSVRKKGQPSKLP